ncbi:MAG: SpaA isopeptide-forming pilin-related protein [Brooklawnia sp.]
MIVPLGAVPTAKAASNATNTGIRQTQTFYSWVKADEMLSLSFEKYASEKRGNSSNPSFNPVIVVKDPSGQVQYTCDALTLDAPIGAEAECKESFTATTDGVWSVEVQRSANVSSTIGQVLMRWSITVTDAGVEKPGRTWSELFRMVDNPYAVETNVNLTLWYQTEHGFTYQVDRLLMQGVDSTFSANAFGNVNTTTCSSAYRTLFGNQSLLENKSYNRIQATNCDFTPYKIFFEAPDTAMPQMVTLPDQTSTWLMHEPTSPEVTDIAFASDAPGSRDGTVTVTVNSFEGNAELQVDVDNDGIFDGPNDRLIPFVVLAGTPAVIAFDGKDTNGDPIPTRVPLAFKVQIDQIGEIHFVDEDLELLTQGIQVTRTSNLPGGDPNTKLYWNDVWVTDRANDPQARIKCSSTPQLVGEGVSSGGGVHSYGTGRCASGILNVNTKATDTTSGGSWGNNRLIDNWTYVDGQWGAIADVPGFILDKFADPQTESTVQAGDTVTYSVTASPVEYAHPELVTEGLEAQTWSGRYTDDVSDVRDNANVPLDDLTSSPAQGSSTVVTGDVWTWTGIGIALPTAVTTTYQAEVTGFADDGTLHNIAYKHTSELPPAPPGECVEGECGETTHYLTTPVGAISVVKTGSTRCLAEGGDPTPVVYTYTVTNVGSEPLTSVSVTDDKGDPVYKSGDLNTDAILTSDETWVFQMAGSLTEPTTNVARASATGKHSKVEVEATGTWSVGESSLTTTKTSSAGGNPVERDGEITYTIIVTNDGSEDASHVTVSDVLPAGLTYVEGSAQKTYPVNGVQVTNAAQVPEHLVSAADGVKLLPGESMTISFRVRVNDPLDASITEFTNTAASSWNDDPICRASASVTDPVAPPRESIQVEKLGRDCDVDQATCALPGALFALYDTDPSLAGATPVTGGIMVDSQDASLFTSIDLLVPGSYWLVETQAPDGFTLLATPIKFTLTSDGISLEGADPEVVAVKGGAGFTIQITDTLTGKLPQAGGQGPWVHFGIGLMLIAGGGAVAITQRQRKAVVHRIH